MSLLELFCDVDDFLLNVELQWKAAQLQGDKQRERALPQFTSAFSTISNSIPRKEAWEDSAGPGLSFPPLLKQ